MTLIPRIISKQLDQALKRQAAVALIGPRQVGKTTLAFELTQDTQTLYLDLENSADKNKLTDAHRFLKQYEDQLVILDEIHRTPELFQTLRGLIDEGRRKGKRTGRFLLLGSASIDLLRQSSETLAGRISYLNMTPLTTLELEPSSKTQTKHWLRGGFPDSFLSNNDEDSFLWRNDFIRTYLERDVAMFGPRIPAETLERLWTMLAHNQAQLLNSSQLAQSLMVSAQTVNRYIDLLVDLLLVRRLKPFQANISKRLVKSPKTYVRDSGLVHALLRIENHESLSGHPIMGSSWEAFVIENLLAAAPPRTQASFYRTAAGAEIDLILELTSQETWAIEIKLSSSPKTTKGFTQALEDIKPSKSFIVYSGFERYPINDSTEIIGLWQLAQLLRDF